MHFNTKVSDMYSDIRILTLGKSDSQIVPIVAYTLGLTIQENDTAYSNRCIIYSDNSINITIGDKTDSLVKSISKGLSGSCSIFEFGKVAFAFSNKVFRGGKLIDEYQFDESCIKRRGYAFQYNEDKTMMASHKGDMPLAVKLTDVDSVLDSIYANYGLYFPCLLDLKKQAKIKVAVVQGNMIGTPSLKKAVDEISVMPDGPGKSALMAFYQKLA